MANKRIIVFGLDGGTWDVLKPFMEKGIMPAFKKLTEGGVHGTLMSTIPARTALAAASFYTGKIPGKWGMFDFSAFDPDVVSYKKIKEKAESLWDILGRHGYRSAILNLPTTYPPTPTRGIMVSGFPPSEQEEYTYPKDFKENIKGFHSERDIFVELVDHTGVKIDREREMLDLHTDDAKKRYRLLRDVIKDKSFDFLVFWLEKSDAAQHNFWGKEDYLAIFFKAVDDILKDIMEQNPETDIFVIADHGFAARPIYDFYPKAWLRKENYLYLKGSRIKQWLIQKLNDYIIGIHPRSKYFPRYKVIKRLYTLYNNVKGFNFLRKKPAPDKKGGSKKNWRDARENRISSRAIGIDWSKTMATNHDFWGIRIIKENLNRNYEEVREEIMRKLMEFKDDSGQNVIKSVWKREDVYQGDDFERFPDIAYFPVSKFEPTGFLPSSIIRKKMGMLKRGGDHLTIRECVFIAAGPNVNNSGDIGQVEMTDIAPTILELFGVAVPQDMDGKILRNIFRR